MLFSKDCTSSFACFSTFITKHSFFLLLLTIFNVDNLIFTQPFVSVNARTVISLFFFYFFFQARLKLCKTFPPNMNIVFVINVLKLAKSPVWSFHVKTLTRMCCTGLYKSRMCLLKICKSVCMFLLQRCSSCLSQYLNEWMCVVVWKWTVTEMGRSGWLVFLQTSCSLLFFFN